MQFYLYITSFFSFPLISFPFFNTKRKNLEKKFKRNNKKWEKLEVLMIVHTKLSFPPQTLQHWKWKCWAWKAFEEERKKKLNWLIFLVFFTSLFLHSLNPHKHNWMWKEAKKRKVWNYLWDLSRTIKKREKNDGKYIEAAGAE